MMTADLLGMRARVTKLDMEIHALRIEREALDRLVRDAESRAWIAANNITPDRVQLSSGDGTPWHGYLHGFAEWMRGQADQKPYAEWNGRLYLTTDLLNGRMVETPGLAQHVPGGGK